MIDIHSHLLYEVDDGASRIEESLKMVSEAEKLGIKVIIATPHFQEGLFDTDKVMEHYHELVKKAAEYDVSIKLGAEIFINPFLPKMMKEDHYLNLNGSRYALIELPFDIIPVYSFETLYALQINNIIPVIAHPERNKNFLRDFDKLMRFIERGCLIQVDAASISGIYGRSVKEFTKRLIKLRLAHFVASDAHCAKDYKDWYQKAYKRVVRWGGEEYADKLFLKNAKAILENVYESIYEMI